MHLNYVVHTNYLRCVLPNWTNIRLANNEYINTQKGHCKQDHMLFDRYIRNKRIGGIYICIS